MNLSDSGMVAFTRDSLHALHAALMRDTGYNAAGYLQEAGYAGGAALYHAFGDWVTGRGVASLDELSVDGFQQLAADFFRECGWGTLTIGDVHETVATLDSSDWGEASPGAGLEYPCCNFTSGMFADFFGRLAGAPLAVMEVECRSTGGERCRFLLGSAEVLQHVYDGMAAGTHYEAAIESAA